MIDIHTDVFNRVKRRVLDIKPKAYVTDEYVRKPPRLPCICVIEIDNQVYRRTLTNEYKENHALITYEISSYSANMNDRKAEAREIMDEADDEMMRMGFMRMSMNQIPNLEDASIYRYVGRYQAVASKDNTVYRR